MVLTSISRFEHWKTWQSNNAWQNLKMGFKMVAIPNVLGTKDTNIFSPFLFFLFYFFIQGEVINAHGSIRAGTTMRWLMGFILYDDDTYPLMENLLAHWALVSLLVQSSITTFRIWCNSTIEWKHNHKVFSYLLPQHSDKAAPFFILFLFSCWIILDSTQLPSLI